MTNSSAQLGQNFLPAQAIYDEVIYQRSLIGLGKVPSGWAFSHYYEEGFRNVSVINFDEAQLVESGLAENAYRMIGVQYMSEEVSIRPYIVQLNQSEFVSGHHAEVYAQVISELNKQVDILVNAKLESLAAEGAAYSWNTPDEFISWALSICCDSDLVDLRKHLIIPEKIRAQLLGYVINPEYRSWYASLAARLAEVNTDLIVSKAATEKVFLAVEPLLAEYTGVEPHLFAQGHNQETHTYWTHFAFSLSDFKLRHSLALQSFQINSVPSVLMRETAEGEMRSSKKGMRLAAGV